MIYIYIHIISEPMTWNLYELVAFQIIFVFWNMTIHIYIYIYIIFCSEQMTWQLHKFGCISDHFCVLQNTDICIYISEQSTWNLYELVACQIMFASYKIMIYIYNFRTNYMKFVWIGCMPGHFCIFKYHDVYIYIYNF